MGPKREEGEMHWLVAGGGGMLGQDAVQGLQARGQSVTAPTRAELDITDPERCLAASTSADVVLNCAGWTAVEAAEDAEGAAFGGNAIGAGNLARASRLAGARMVHVSSDYVFDGRARTPYAEDAPLSPCSAYGRSKAAGEWAVRAEQPDHLLIRTAWLYGEYGPCFPKAIARRASAATSLGVVDDQWGQPTWTVDVVDLLVRLVEHRAPPGIYHATARGTATWCAFARDVVAAAGRDSSQIRAIQASEYPSRVSRPAYSVLGHEALERLGMTPIGDWRERWRLAADRILSGIV